MKLPSSPSTVYSIIYFILFLLSFVLHFILQPIVSSALIRVYIIDFSITCILFYIGNYMFMSNNIYDLHWPLIPLICSIYFYITSNTIYFFSLKRLSLILIIGLWSIHLIRQTICSTTNIYHEDWRYQLMRKQYENNFILFALFGLHLFPMFQVLIGSSSLYYIYNNTHVNSTPMIIDILLYLFIVSGVLLEIIADKQLRDFRIYKQKFKQHRFAVLCDGLWKYSRHPNYLGEMIFWWGLIFLGYRYNAPWWCGFGPLLITIMMLVGSIPMSEERLFRRYPDYKFVQRQVSMLIPTFG